MKFLRWTKAARRDLIDIWEWRGRDRPELGDLALDRIIAACERLTRFPYFGPAFPRVAPDARKLTIERYLALYRIESDGILIVRVIDQRRLLEAISVNVD